MPPPPKPPAENIVAPRPGRTDDSIDPTAPTLPTVARAAPGRNRPLQFRRQRIWKLRTHSALV